MKITWNTDVAAPGCPGEIVAEDGRSVLIQTDWDYPGVASSFGWTTKHVQKCPDCAGRAEGPVFGHCLQCDHAWGWPELCDHQGTDGTVDCKECGVTASQFIEAARVFLDDNDGLEADDPGYFQE